MRLIIHDEAQLELQSAARRYGAAGIHLELDFLSKVEDAIREILADPARFPLDEYSPRNRVVRMARTKRFPYKVVFVAGEDLVHVIAVSHHRRAPRHWRNRL